jgi:RluA family pseudouridine synthase
LIAAGGVFVDGARCRVASRVVRAGVRLRIAKEMPDTPPAPLVIIYEDADCIAIDKPASMPAAPTRSAAAGTALDALGDQLSRTAGRRVPLWLVHRLDAPTSGVLLFAKTRTAAGMLGKAFQERTMTKTYVALIGIGADTSALRTQAAGCIDLPLRNVGGRAKVVADGKPAQTEWQILQRGRDTMLLRLHPVTGRLHQLRAHLRAVGHPILGDRLYGGPPAARLMLHAATLSFPRNGDPIEIVAPAPAIFALAHHEV